MIAKTNEKKEYAASVFIKWLTSPEQNMRFISKTGYLPVTKQAFEQDMNTRIENIEDTQIRKMLTTVLSMYESYDLFTAPNFNNFDSVSNNYENNFKSLMAKQRDEYLAGSEVTVKNALDEMKEMNK